MAAREAASLFEADAMHPAVAVGLVFGGCCSNVVFLELLARCGAGERFFGGVDGGG